MEKQKPYNPPEEGLARDINRGRPGVHIVFFPSVKNSRVIICESQLEADFCQLLEFDPDVVSYIPQPVTISLWIDGLIRDYTPDFQVSYKLRPDAYFEVKPATVTSWDEYMKLMRHVEQHFAEKEQEFTLMLDSEIRKEPYLGNLKFLYSKIHRVSKNESAYLLELMRRLGGEAVYEELLEMEGAPTIGAIAKAVFERKIELDITKSFDHETMLRLI